MAGTFGRGGGRITALLMFKGCPSVEMAACCPECGYWVYEWTDYRTMRGRDDLSARCSACGTHTTSDALELAEITDKLRIETEIIHAT